MSYTFEGTTKRYEGNTSCYYANLTPQKEDLYRYGCEFEFYVDIQKHQYHEVIDALRKGLYELTHADILVDEISIPQSVDKNDCMQIKPDISLEDHGLEISVPISSKEGIIHYIKNILPLIEKYGYSNEETGFHIHMSSLGSRHIDFHRFMLLCDDTGLLSSWEPRVGYSQNVMDILSTKFKQEARVIKTKKGTIWNLEKIDSHHIEIKSIGGVDYHKHVTRIVDEFTAYTEHFSEALSMMSIEHKVLLKRHKELVASLGKEAKGRFASALIEAGILEK